MSDLNLLGSLFKALDKVVLGTEQQTIVENQYNFMELDNEEEFDVERSSN